MAAPMQSLRERSKAKRRAAIQRAAMRQFAERGYDNTTIAEIAAEAEVAPRTVSTYFPTKLDLAISLSSDLGEQLATTFRTHPDLSYTEVVDLWLEVVTETTDPELAALTNAMLDANPSLRAAATTNLDELTGVTSRALFAEAGIDPDDPMSGLLNATIATAITAYVGIAVKSGSPADLRRRFDRFLRAIIKAAR